MPNSNSATVGDFATDSASLSEALEVNVGPWTLVGSGAPYWCSVLRRASPNALLALALTLISIPHENLVALLESMALM